MRWNAFTLGLHRQNSSHSSEKYLNILRIRVNRARSTLYRARWPNVEGKALQLNVILWYAMHITWCSGNEMAWRAEGPGLYSEWNLFLFSSSFFFSFSFTFCLLLSYCSFALYLYIAKFFKFINFLPYCFISLSTSCCSPEVLRFTYF